MGSCCSSNTDVLTVPAQCQIKVINSISELISQSDCSKWPNGLSHGVFLSSLEDIDENDSNYPSNWNQTLRDLSTKIKSLFLEGLKDKKQTLHCIFVCLMSIEPEFFDIDEKQYTSISETIVDLIENEYFVTTHNDTVGKFDKQTKNFIKFILSWCFDDPYNDKGDEGANHPKFKKLKQLSIQCMDTLQITLNEEYDRISQCNTKFDKQLIELEYDKPSSNAFSHITNQRDLYPKFTEWVVSVVANGTNKKSELTEQSLSEAVEIFTDHKLPNPEIVPYLFDETKFVLDEDVYLEFFRQISTEIDGSFQAEMKQLFEENRQEYKKMVDMKEDDKDAIFKSAPIKTCGRAFNKTAEDYIDAPDPACGNILDWVRCALVVYDTHELMMLYSKLLEKYNNGEIIRVKNGFKKGTKGNYGYRAILMNLLYEANGFSMIVEVQLILLKYLKVRKSMHLFYKIARAEDATSLAMDVSKITDVDKTKTKDWLLIDDEI